MVPLASGQLAQDLPNCWITLREKKWGLGFGRGDSDTPYYSQARCLE
jgi:hypothetical protein